jgi:phosphatidylserine/phosphatidylglycerophosphate/cardiolipin synthase-like enzyme
MHNCNFEFLADRNSTLKDVYNSMRSARSCICVVGWPFSHELQLDPGDTNSVLGELLAERSKVVPVHIILWQEKPKLGETTGNSFFEKANSFFTEAKKRGSKVQITSYSNEGSHLKFIICDGVGYVGSVDLSTGRANTEHPLFTFSEKRDQLIVSPKLNSDKTLPWHEVECRVTGSIVEELAKVFEQLWRRENNAPEFELPKSTYVHDPNNLWNIQLLHTTPGVGETKLNFYRAIRRARKYIYLETQVMNLDYFVLDCIAEQIVKNRRRDFKVIIVCSLCPYIRDTSKSMEFLQSLLQMQFQNIEALLFMLHRASHEAGVKINADDCIIFGCLGTVEQKNKDVFEKDVIPVHSEVLIVDDKYISIGSKNLSEQNFKSNSELYETVIGASPEFTTQLETIRQLLFKKHFGEDLQDPSAPDFVSKLRQLGETNKNRFNSNEPFVRSNGRSTLFMNTPGIIQRTHLRVFKEAIAFFSEGSIGFDGELLELPDFEPIDNKPTGTRASQSPEEHQEEAGEDLEAYRGVVALAAKAAGLDQKRFQEYLSHTNQLLMHQPPEYWIHTFVESSAAEDLPSNKAESYVQLGFSCAIAQGLAERITPNFADHHDAFYFASHQVQECTVSEDLLQTLRLPENETKTTKTESVQDRELTYYIFDKIPNQKDLETDILTIEEELDDNYQYWYHGTTGMNAENIIARGINPQKGKGSQDFSCSDRRGFYLSTCLANGVEWVFNRWPNCRNPVVAVLIYKVDKRLLALEKRHHKDLSEDKEPNSWKQFVRACRSDEKHPYKQCITSIFGSMCNNAGKLKIPKTNKKKGNEHKWKPTKFDPDKLQLVLLDVKQPYTLFESSDTDTENSDKDKEEEIYVSNIVKTFNQSLHAIVWITSITD